jgi:hypothetical protein
MDKERRGSEGEAKRRILMFEQFIKFTHSYLQSTLAKLYEESQDMCRSCMCFV